MSSQVELSTSRLVAGRGKLGSEKVLGGYIRRTVTGKKRGLALRILYRRGGRPGVGRPRQAFTRPFHPLSRIGSSLSIWHRAQSRPTCPSSFHHCQPPSFRPKIRLPFTRRTGCPRSSANEDNRANTSYALYYRVCRAQRWTELEIISFWRVQRDDQLKPAKLLQD